MEVYKGQPCPQCGCDHHHVVNASMPTVNECTNCHNLWNPDNVDAWAETNTIREWHDFWLSEASEANFPVPERVS